MKNRFWLLVALVAGLTVPTFALAHQFSIGDKVDFTVRDENGKSVKLSKYKGKVIALVFYASWWAGCNEEAPRIEKYVWQGYKKKGVQVLGLAIQEQTPKAKIQLFRKRHHITYPLLSDEDQSVATMFGVKSIPTIIILDKLGRYTEQDPESFKTTFQKLLK